MGTAKRERQKTNRALKLQEEAKAARVSTVKRGALRWGIGALVAIAGVVLIAFIGGAFDGDSNPDVGITTPLTTPLTIPTTTPELTVPEAVSTSSTP